MYSFHCDLTNEREKLLKNIKDIPLKFSSTHGNKIYFFLQIEDNESIALFVGGLTKWRLLLDITGDLLIVSRPSNIINSFCTHGR